VRNVRNFSRGSKTKRASPTIEVEGVVKMSRVEAYGDHEGYWTETVDVSARGPDGRNLFHSFHVLAVPEGEVEGLRRARRRFRESLIARLEEAAESLSPEGFSAN
jgi:hypothetical protein